MKEPELKLFMVLLGANPKGRNVEQHDYFFGIGSNLKELVPAIRAFWPEAGNSLHIDGWREINFVDGCGIKVVLRDEKSKKPAKRLFFINLGGYLTGKLQEQHHIMLTIQDDRLPAIKESMKTLFYKTNSAKGAHSHIDEKFGVDVDDVYRLEDVLSTELKEQFHVRIIPVTTLAEDELHLGYFKLDKIV
jgi:hypothetical protein